MRGRGRELALAAAVLVVGAGCRAGGAQETSEPEVVAVRTAGIEQERIARPIVASGVLGPKEEIGLSFRAGGVIERITVDAGDVVKAGQLLASLDLREIEAAVTRAESAAEDAERDLARARRLYESGALSLSAVQDAETRMKAAQADLEAARSNRRYAVITAPSGGVILRRLAEPGEVAAPGAPVLVLGSDARGSVVRVGLTDRDVLRVSDGDRARVRFDALPERVFEGRVTEISAAAEPGTGTYPVEVQLPAGAPRTAGLVAEVEIQPASGVMASLVPVEAVLEADGDGATVFVLSTDGQRAERRRVRVAWLLGDRVALLDGLHGATQVITEGAAWLRDGEKVRVLQ